MDNNKTLDSKATLDDIVFEERNKSYGAYLIRKLYDKSVLIALLISITVFSLLLAMPVILNYFFPEEVVVVKEEPKKETKLISIPLNPNEPPPLPIEQPPPPEIKQVKFIAYEQAPDEEVRENIKQFNDSSNISTINKDGVDSVANIIPIQPVGEGVLPAEDDNLYTGSVSKETEFPGGMAGFANYLRSHINRKAIAYAQDRGIKGKVYISFEVKKDGTIDNVSVITGRGLPDCQPCNEAAIEVIKSMPKWTPAEHNGHIVRRLVKLPIGF